jgi:hypothetical protein
VIKRKQRFISYVLIIFSVCLFTPTITHAGFWGWFNFGKNTYDAVKAEQDIQNGIVSEETKQWLEENNLNERRDALLDPDFFPCQDVEMQKTINTLTTRDYAIEKIGDMTKSGADASLSLYDAPYNQPITPSLEEASGADKIDLFKKIKSTFSFIVGLFKRNEEFTEKTQTEAIEETVDLNSLFEASSTQQENPEKEKEEWKLVSGDLKNTCTNPTYEGKTTIKGWYVYETGYIEKQWLLRIADEDMDKLPSIFTSKTVSLMDATPEQEEALKKATEDNPVEITIRNISQYCEGGPTVSIKKISNDQFKMAVDSLVPMATMCCYTGEEKLDDDFGNYIFCKNDYFKEKLPTIIGEIIIKQNCNSNGEFEFIAKPKKDSDIDCTQGICNSKGCSFEGC